MLKFKTNQKMFQKEVSSDTEVSNYGRHDPACIMPYGAIQFNCLNLAYHVLLGNCICES